MAAITELNAVVLGNPQIYQSLIASSTNTTVRVQTTTEKIAFKFYATSTQAITDIDFKMAKTGTVTGINFKMEIQTDNADKPSGTVLGGATAEFAGVATTGNWTGLKALTSNTGSLTIGTPYWLVLYYSSGTSPDASNYIYIYRSSTSSYGGGKLRNFNGTDWTTVTALTGVGYAVYKLADGSYVGLGASAAGGAASGLTKVFSTNRQGLQMKFAVPVEIQGVYYRVAKAGTPSTLDFDVYSGSTLLYSQTVQAADITSITDTICLFASPVFIPAGVNCYIILHQTSNGGTTGNDYDVRVTSAQAAAYLPTLIPSTWALVSGTNTDPTQLSVSTTLAPALAPIIQDPSTDFAPTVIPMAGE